MRVELLNKPTRGTVAANRERGRCPDGKKPAGYSTKCDNKTSLIAAFQLKNMENSWGTRTRTRKGRTRICSVANYTIPQTCRRNRDALSITPANLQTSPILTKISQRFFKKNSYIFGHVSEICLLRSAIFFFRWEIPIWSLRSDAKIKGELRRRLCHHK